MPEFFVAINILSEQWKDLDETTRRKKSEDYHMELEEYIKQVREHCIPFTGPPRKTKSEEKLTNIFAKPKKPASPYSLFVADQFKQQIIKQKFEKVIFNPWSFCL